MKKEIQAQEATRKAQFLETMQLRREENFRHGHPHLILHPDLPEGQAYYEYANGHIEIREMQISEEQRSTRLVRLLAPEEAEKVRRYDGLQ